MFSFLKSLFGTAQSRTLAKYDKLVSQINAHEQKLQNLDDTQVRAKTQEFRERLQKGEALDLLLQPAFP